MILVGGIQRTFNKFKNKDKLKVIYTTEQYPSHPISISNKIEKKLFKKIEKALLLMPLKNSLLINKKPLVKTNNNEYKTVKDLAIKMGIFTN